MSESFEFWYDNRIRNPWKQMLYPTEVDIVRTPSNQLSLDSRRWKNKLMEEQMAIDQFWGWGTYTYKAEAFVRRWFYIVFVHPFYKKSDGW